VPSLAVAAHGGHVATDSSPAAKRALIAKDDIAVEGVIDHHGADSHIERREAAAEAARVHLHHSGPLLDQGASVERSLLEQGGAGGTSLPVDRERPRVGAKHEAAEDAR